jgi:uncharacterized protein (TIGR02246 family)
MIMLTSSNAAPRFLGPLTLVLILAAQPATAQTTLSPADSVQMSAPALAPETAAPMPEAVVQPAPVQAEASPDAPAVVAAAAPVAPAIADTVAFSELRQLDEQWADANVRNDAEKMSQLMAPDYVSINSKGQVMQRPDMLRAIASGRAKTIVNKGFDYHIRVYGNVGVVMHNTSFMGSLNGLDTSGEYRSTHLYVRREGRWQLTSSQSTYVAPPDSRATLSAHR